MAVEVNLRSKILYKAQLYLLKVIPMVMAFICFRKQAGFKELSWTKKDLDEFIKQCKKK